jgi:hypothetical protein
MIQEEMGRHKEVEASRDSYQFLFHI